MALDTPGLKAGIKALVADMRAKDSDDDDYYAEKLSKLIETYVKSGDVQAGIAVRTTGTASLQTGVTTATGKIV